MPTNALSALRIESARTSIGRLCDHLVQVRGVQYFGVRGTNITGAFGSGWRRILVATPPWNSFHGCPPAGLNWLLYKIQLKRP